MTFRSLPVSLEACRQTPLRVIRVRSCSWILTSPLGKGETGRHLRAVVDQHGGEGGSAGAKAVPHQLEGVPGVLPQDPRHHVALHPPPPAPPLLAHPLCPQNAAASRVGKLHCTSRDPQLRPTQQFYAHQCVRTGTGTGEATFAQFFLAICSGEASPGNPLFLNETNKQAVTGRTSSCST